MRVLQRRLVLMFVAVALAGCVAYYPTPVPGMSSFDRSWEAALAAADDTGVTVSLADRATGRIRGSRSGVAVSISVITQADASVRVEINAGTTPLADQLTAAYHRRMGR